MSILTESTDEAAEPGRRKLGIFRIAAFVLSAAAPLTVFCGVITVGYATTGIIGLGLAFLVIGAVLAIFCVGFNAMSRRISNAGAFYAYSAQGLGRPIGVSTGLVAALAYNLLQVGLYGSFGAAVSPLVNPVVGANLPWWFWSGVAWLVIAMLGLLPVDLNSTILLVLMGVEVLVVLIFNLGNLTHPAGGTITFDAFDPSALFVPGVGALFVIAITGFVGFEGTAIYSENARNPRRTVPRSTYLCLTVIAVLYGLCAWSLVVAIGSDRVADVIGANPIEAVFTLAAANLGPVWSTIGHALFATSIFAAMTSYHVAVGFYMFALGREGVLPRFFAQTTRAGTPKWGSLFQSALGLIVIAVYAIANLDPVVQLFFWAGTTGGFGVLVLLAVTSVAVIGYHIRTRHENVWRGVVAPMTAGVLMAVVLYLAIDNFDTLLGVAPDAPVRWILPSLFGVVGVVGLLWALVMRRTRPDLYDTIGLGANASTGRAINLQTLVGDREELTP